MSQEFGNSTLIDISHYTGSNAFPGVDPASIKSVVPAALHTNNRSSDRNWPDWTTLYKQFFGNSDNLQGAGSVVFGGLASASAAFMCGALAPASTEITVNHFDFFKKKHVPFKVTGFSRVPEENPGFGQMMSLKETTWVDNNHSQADAPESVVVFYGLQNNQLNHQQIPQQIKDKYNITTVYNVSCNTRELTPDHVGAVTHEMLRYLQEFGPKQNKHLILASSMPTPFHVALGIHCNPNTFGKVRFLEFVGNAEYQDIGSFVNSYD